MNAFTSPDREIGRLGAQLAHLRANIDNLAIERHTVRGWLANPSPDTTEDVTAAYEMRIATLEAQLAELRAGRAETLVRLAELISSEQPDVPVGPVPQHLDPEFGHRDYAGMPALAGADDHGELMTYESSSVEGPHFWVRAEGAAGELVRVHVTADTAWKFAEQLITLVRNSLYGDATPAGVAYQVSPLFGAPSREVTAA